MLNEHAERSHELAIAYWLTHIATRFIRVVTFSIAIAVAALTVSLAAMSASGDGAKIPLLNRELLIVRSGSMSPTFDTGDAVIVRSISSSPQTIEPGTVVTFKSSNNDGLLVTHRVVKVETSGRANPSYVTKGDANTSIDESPLTLDHLVGVVAGHIPRGGYVLYALQRPQLLAATIGAALLAQAAVMVTRRTTPKTEREKHEEHP